MPHRLLRVQHIFCECLYPWVHISTGRKASFLPLSFSRKGYVYTMVANSTQPSLSLSLSRALDWSLRQSRLWGRGGGGVFKKAVVQVVIQGPGDGISITHSLTRCCTGRRRGQRIVLDLFLPQTRLANITFTYSSWQKLTVCVGVWVFPARDLIVFSLPSKKGEFDKVNIDDAYPFSSHQVTPQAKALGRGPWDAGMCWLKTASDQ